MANALKPLSGMTPEQYRVYKQRFQLSLTNKIECAALDYKLAASKQRSLNVPPADRAVVEVGLYKSRKRFNDLNC